MSHYTVMWQADAVEDLHALPKHIAKRIKQKIDTHLSQNPLALGKRLSGEFAELYRYRIGDYRIIYELKQQDILIIIVKVGHRKDVYDGH